MKTLTLAILALALLLPTAASAQVEIRLGVPLPPTVQMVVVSPGVQVIEDYDEEVFFSDGYYWTRRDERWYRARSPRAAFVPVRPRYVPASLVGLPPRSYRYYRREPPRHEHYKHKEWKSDKHRGDHGRGHDRDDRDDRGHGHGHGRR